jgi:hypothetical protein
VGSYTITFTPDDVSNASAVVRVDLGGAGARITELTVRAGNGDGLVPGELPGFDLGRLMRAIAPAGPATPAFELSATPMAPAATITPYATEPEPEPAPAPARKTAAKRTTAGRTTTGRAGAGRTAASRTPAKRTTAKQTAAKQAAAKKTAAKAATGTGRGRKAATASAAGARSGGTGRATKRTAGTAAARTATRGAQGTGRAYRRAPDDIAEVFAQAPSATALARHYGVPRHTVQGWLRRLRSEGVLPPSSRS